MAIQKIVITGDFTRVDEFGRFCQSSNIKWLHQLLSPLLAMLCGLQPESLIGDCGHDGNMGEKFYRAQGDIPSLDIWARMYDGEFNPRQNALMVSRFNNSLVIGFELSPAISRALSNLEIPFIDFTIHPVRFLRELLFGIRSNVIGISEDFAPWKVGENRITLEAGAARAFLSRLPRLDCCQDAEDIGVFACQTYTDRALIRNARLPVIDDFAEEFNKIANLHEKLLIIPHPYGNDRQIELYFKQFFVNTQIAKNNLYHVITHDNITKVYSISSSACIEAAYLGKDATHLRTYPFTFSDSVCSKDIYLAVESCLLQPKLWRNILSRIGLNVTTNKLPCINVDMRKSLNSYWGADIFFSR